MLPVVMVQLLIFKYLIYRLQQRHERLHSFTWATSVLICRSFPLAAMYISEQRAVLELLMWAALKRMPQVSILLKLADYRCVTMRRFVDRSVLTADSTLGTGEFIPQARSLSVLRVPP